MIDQFKKYIKKEHQSTAMYFFIHIDDQLNLELILPIVFFRQWKEEGIDRQMEMIGTSFGVKKIIYRTYMKEEDYYLNKN
jgi:hypothetical protein